MSELNLKPSVPAPSQSRPILSSSLLNPWVFDYSSSPDGNDLNLLILFHGLGDTKQSFAELGKKLNLPSTATLALQAPDPIPLLEHPAYSWYNTFTPFFEPLPDPNPRTILPPLRKLIETLISPEVGWDLTAIHLFGFGQGGTTALELALDIGRDGAGPSKAVRFGSTTSICASLLSPISAEINLQTPICTFSRQDTRSAQAQKYQKRLEATFAHVESLSGEKGPDAMPKNRDEWKGIMKFWGEVLVKAEGWRGGGEVFEVIR